MIINNVQIEAIYTEYENSSKDDLKYTLIEIDYEIENLRIMLDEENKKFEKFKVNF
jgi:hypothetical protein